MDRKRSKDIRIIVNSEKDLYNPLSPDNEFNGNVKQYIKTKYADAKLEELPKLTVISSVPLDEDRFRSAAANWILEEEAAFRQEANITRHMLIGLLVIASVFIILSLSLQEHFSVLSYTIIPVLGSVALGRAAGICLTDLPIYNARKHMIKEMKKNSIIVFEYPEA